MTRYDSPHSRPGGAAWSDRYMRLKHYRGELYFRQQPQTFKGYAHAFLGYYYSLLQQYSAHLPHFDIIIRTFDCEENSSLDYHSFPYFVSDGYQETVPPAPYLLHSISRSLANRLHARSTWNPAPEPLSVEDDQDELSWQDKRDIVFFAGGPTNEMRDAVAYAVNKDANHTDFFVKIVADHHCNKPCKLCNTLRGRCYIDQKIPSEEETKYKYLLVIDGYAVRDAFSRQMNEETVLLKQNSNYVEFWYHDLVNHRHFILWNNVSHLLQIVHDMRKHGDPSNATLAEIALNAKRFGRDYLNIDSVNCFQIHMLQLYTHYFYDAESIELDSNDIKITETLLSSRNIELLFVHPRLYWMAHCYVPLGASIILLLYLFVGLYHAEYVGFPALSFAMTAMAAAAFGVVYCVLTRVAYTQSHVIPPQTFALIVSPPWLSEEMPRLYSYAYVCSLLALLCVALLPIIAYVDMLKEVKSNRWWFAWLWLIACVMSAAAVWQMDDIHMLFAWLILTLSLSVTAYCLFSWHSNPHAFTLTLRKYMKWWIMCQIAMLAIMSAHRFHTWSVTWTTAVLYRLVIVAFMLLLVETVLLSRIVRSRSRVC
eukprot:CAMPEP_0197028844 /NCGR_PEP_ID=MMETSP1384-20130603/8434_1 /TAXON_ID=29189 /ORGANISM="Ammonia sp." /LENGTH=594 /DNA_ID=CAMNT_0042457905 /DNA_START=360 /DNA_END=2141 /DNA_ORIENTATION=-